MDPLTIIALVGKAVSLAIQLFPTVVKTIADARPFAERLFKAIKGDDTITPEEQESLEAELQRLSDELQLPLPPE